MDHRCLYGHRVPAAFTFAIQSRSCPTCGAPTVTLTGYQAARKLTLEAGLDAVGAFTAVRVLEAEWVLTPVANGEDAAASAPGPVLGAVEAAPVASPEEDEVVVEDVVEPAAAAPSAVSAPEPRITSRTSRGDKVDEGRKPRGERTGATGPVGASAASVPQAGGRKDTFDPGEEDFFKGT